MASSASSAYKPAWLLVCPVEMGPQNYKAAKKKQGSHRCRNSIRTFGTKNTYFQGPVNGWISPAFPVVSLLATEPQIAVVFSTSQTTRFPQSGPPTLKIKRSLALKHSDWTTNLWMSYRVTSSLVAHCHRIILPRDMRLCWPEATREPLKFERIREVR